MKEQKHEFPKGITEEVLREIYQNKKEVSSIEYTDDSISVHFPYSVPHLIWNDYNGFGHCPSWVRQELINRGLAPEIRKEKPEPRPIDSLTEEEWKSVIEALVGRKLEVLKMSKDEYVFEFVFECKHGGWYDTISFVFKPNSNEVLFCDLDHDSVNQYAAFKRLEELGVDLNSN